MKLFIVCVALLLGLLVSAVPARAASAEVELPAFPITINGVRINNEYLVHPLVVYRNITYFPLTYYNSRFVGLGTNYTADIGLSVWLMGMQNDYHGIYQEGANPPGMAAQIPYVPIRINGAVIDNSIEAFPLLLIRDVVYFPLTWRFMIEEFGWYSRFDSDEGLVIYTDNSAHMETFLAQLVYDTMESATDTIPFLSFLPANHGHVATQWCYERGFPEMRVYFYTGEFTPFVAPNEYPEEMWRHIAFFDLNTRRLRALWSSREILVVLPDNSVTLIAPPRRHWVIIEFA